MNLANLFEGYADTALAAWNDPKSKSADQKSSKFYLQSYLFHLRCLPGSNLCFGDKWS